MTDWMVGSETKEQLDELDQHEQLVADEDERMHAIAHSRRSMDSAMRSVLR